MLSRFNLEPETAIPIAATIASSGIAIVQTRRRQMVERHAEQLHYAATHDKLTGALNTYGLEELLTTNEAPHAMLYADGTFMKTLYCLIVNEGKTRLP